MTDAVRELHDKVLTLPADERAALLELLLASLEPKSADQLDWAQVAQQRRADVLSGKVEMIPGEVAMAGIRAKLA